MEKSRPASTPSPRPPTPSTIDILGVSISTQNSDELTAELVDRGLRNVRTRVHYANAHSLNLAARDDGFRRLMNRADIVVPDGSGVQLGALLLGQPVPPRDPYADWIWTLAARMARSDLSLFLLGGRPGVARDASRRLQAAAPDLQIAGHHHGYFDLESSENQFVLDTVRDLHPDVLFVCMGMPRQETWIDLHFETIGATVVIAGGGVLDFVSQQARRAPSWLRKAGLEWLGRLAREPRRLAARYLLGNPEFIARIVLERVRSGRPPDARPE